MKRCYRSYSVVLIKSFWPEKMYHHFQFMKSRQLYHIFLEVRKRANKIGIMQGSADYELWINFDQVPAFIYL